MTMAYIKTLLDDNDDIVYPQTKTNAIFASDGQLFSNIAATKPTITTSTLTAASWNSNAKTYSFESQYSKDTYNIEIDFDGDNGTAEQYSAYCSAQIVGSTTTNIIKALGDVPTVDIPIIIYATLKEA